MTAKFNATRVDAASADVDVIVIGSGFGGAVAALRLAEKGYRVHMYEAGRRFEDEDFATTSWDLKRFLWAPELGCYGIQRIHVLPHVAVLAGAGVGGGSLNYANTHYVPPKEFFTDRQWGHITDWQDELAPHYAMAQRMLGSTGHELDGPAEEAMRRTAEAMGVGSTFRRTPVGVWFGTPEKRVADPYFGGAGPDRTGCTLCGNCMVGCRVGAKNTLMKNYLALAEKLGVTIEPMRTVTHLGEVPGSDPSSPVMRVRTERTGARGAAKDPRVLTARHVVLAAGTWGTQQLLHAMAGSGDLPRLSPRLGELTRTNSEALLGAMTERVPDGGGLDTGVAITTSFHPASDTHVEAVRYGKGSNSMGLLISLLVPGDTPGIGLGKLLRHIRRHPEEAWTFVRHPPIRRWSERTVILLVMQTLDNSITLSRRGKRGLTSRQGHGEPNPSWIPLAHNVAREVAKQLAEVTGVNAVIGGNIGEPFNMPMTAHFLGGVPIADSPERGVIDPYHRLYGHPSISVVDGSAVSANLGVNPSLTITAQSERAFSLWPNRGEADSRPVPGASYRRVEPVPARHPAVTRWGPARGPADGTADNAADGAATTAAAPARTTAG